MEMKILARLVGLAGALVFAAAPAANTANGKVYILNGYSFGGFGDTNTAEQATKLKDQEGARVTQADITVDETMLATELRARNIKGRLFTTIAEKNGRIWLIFDLQVPRPGLERLAASEEHLKSQVFAGATQIPAADLAAATGLKPGDMLSFEKINTARQGLLALYAKSIPGRTPSIRGKMQTTADGRVVLTWMIGEQ
jgi:outer membrane protein assembly factor BamA